MPRSASSLVSLRLTVDFGIPSNAAAFDRLRFSTTLPNTSRASRSNGGCCSTVSFPRVCGEIDLGPLRRCLSRLAELSVPNMQQGVAAVYLFSPFPQLLVSAWRWPDESRQPGDQTRERTLDRRLSRTRPRAGVARGLCFEGFLRKGARTRLQEDVALHGAGGACSEVGQLFHPRVEVPQHLDHHRAGQGRRDPRASQHLPAPRQQDAVGGRPVRGGGRARAPAVLPLPRLALQTG